MSIQNEMSSTFRRSLMVAIPVATIVGLTALAYAGLTVFSSGQPLSSATMNANFADLQAQITALQTATGVGPDGGTLTVPTSPPGTIIAYAGAISVSHPIPSGYLYCDGSAVSRTTYANLLDVIGVAYGTGDQVTTFNLPDLRGYFLRGLDTTSGGANDPDVSSRTAQNTGGNTGAEVGTFEGDVFASHNHGVNDPGHNHPGYGNANFLYHDYAPGGGFCAGGYAGGGNFSPSICEIGGTGGAATGISIAAAGGAETRPRNVAVNYIIKF